MKDIVSAICICCDELIGLAPESVASIAVARQWVDGSASEKDVLEAHQASRPAWETMRFTDATFPSYCAAKAASGASYAILKSSELATLAWINGISMGMHRVSLGGTQAAVGGAVRGALIDIAIDIARLVDGAQGRMFQRPRPSEAKLASLLNERSDEHASIFLWSDSHVEIAREIPHEVASGGYHTDVRIAQEVREASARAPNGIVVVTRDSHRWRLARAGERGEAAYTC